MTPAAREDARRTVTEVESILGDLTLLSAKNDPVAQLAGASLYLAQVVLTLLEETAP